MSLFNQGLLITAIGMGLVFVMIFALWGIMALLVKLTNKPEAEEETEEVMETAQVSEVVPAQDPPTRNWLPRLLLPGRSRIRQALTHSNPASKPTAKTPGLT